MRMSKGLLGSVAGLCLLATSAVAGTDTLTVKDGGGANYTFANITNGAGDHVAKVGICDGTAAASCLTITGGVASVSAAQSGAWTVQPGNTQNTTPWLTSLMPGATSATGIASVASTAAESCHVLKGSAGNLLSLTVTLGATSGWVLVFDATSAPMDGAGQTPSWWSPVTSNGTFGSISSAWLVPLNFATGITACFSTTGPFTKTASSTAAFSAQVK